MSTDQRNTDTFKPYASYSQNGEDMLLRALLSENGYLKAGGFYIDIGAHHPFRFSNTAYFYETGWRGINIEPTPAAVKLFDEHRDRDISLNIGVGERRDKQTFYCFSEASLNTFDPDAAKSREQEGNHIVETTEVDILPLADILDEHLPAGTSIDFMSIDVAGLDLGLLQSNNWEKYKPVYLLIEDVNSSGAVDAEEIYNFLREKGYEQLSYKTPRTLIFKAR